MSFIRRDSTKLTQYFDDPYIRPERYVRTTHGCIRGRRCETVYGDFYYSFERIPFAQPPMGELRFKAPVPVKPWFILLDCTDKAQKPLQYDTTKNYAEGNEDCLYLNFYVKRFCTECPLPIMVYLYGGGFEKGDPTRTRLGPDYLMSRQIVLVTIAYRLGALGFLSLEDPDADCPGNAALKDQLLGLKWVKANARAFNGDPNNITLFGNSAGAVCAHYLSMTPVARGLFNKVILQSGTALCPFALCTLKCMPYRLAKALGYQGKMKDTKILKFLQKANGEQIVSLNLLTKEENSMGHIFNFGPVVEPYMSSHCIIPYRPEVLLTKAWGNRIPMLIGGTSFEGLSIKYLLLKNPVWLQEAQTNPSVLLPKNVVENCSKKKQSELAEIILETHFKDNEISVENIMTFCEFISYCFFWHPIHRTILSRQWYSYVPTYVYRFDFDSPNYNLSRIRHCGPDERGATHADELGYLFHSTDSKILDINTCEFRTIKRLIGIWTRFARNSNPNCKKQQNREWKPVDQDENKPIECLNISRKLEVIELPEFEKLQSWNKLYEESYDYDTD